MTESNQFPCRLKKVERKQEDPEGGGFCFEQVMGRVRAAVVGGMASDETRKLSINDSYDGHGAMGATPTRPARGVRRPPTSEVESTESAEMTPLTKTSPVHPVSPQAQARAEFFKTMQSPSGGTPL